MVRRGFTSVRAHPVTTVLIVLGGVIVGVFLLLVGLNLLIVLGLLAATAVGGVVLYLLARRTFDVHEAPAIGRLAVGSTAVSALLVFGLIQLIPYGHDHSNPPVTGEPRWANARTRELMVDACYACHSNEVKYPAYASVAPLSWAVQRHVDEGREAVNYSEFATDPGDAEDSAKVVDEGEMPPAVFTRFGRHPEANLSEAELRELIAGLRATPGLSGEGEHGSSDGD